MGQWQTRDTWQIKPYLMLICKYVQNLSCLNPICKAYIGVCLLWVSYQQLNLTKRIVIPLIQYTIYMIYLVSMQNLDSRVNNVTFVRRISPFQTTFYAWFVFERKQAKKNFFWNTQIWKCICRNLRLSSQLQTFEKKLNSTQYLVLSRSAILNRGAAEPLGAIKNL